jgi:Rrf2 family protein
MQPTTRFATAIQVLAFLTESRTFKTSEQLGQKIGTHPVVIRRILLTLRRAGLLTSQKGPGGGAKIARPPATISLRDIYRAVEEDRPLSLPTSAGSRMRKVNRVLLVAHERSRSKFEEVLSHVTLASVLRSSQGRFHSSGRGR